MSKSTPVHRSALEAFSEHLRRAGFAAGLDPSPEVPCHTLVVRMLADEGVGVPYWQIALAFVPDLEREVESVSFLQCFSMLPYAIAPAAAQEVTRLILQTNATLPLVGFGYLEQPRAVYYRHVQMLPSDALEKSAPAVEQTAWMITLLLDRFAPAFAHAASAGTRAQANGAPRQH
jgi:hypothetical protein